MAVGLKSRIIYREKTKEDGAADYWAGEYKLLIRAKSIPSPFGAVNMVDTSTLEDLIEREEEQLHQWKYQVHLKKNIRMN